MPEQEKEKLPGQWTDSKLDAEATPAGGKKKHAPSGAATISPAIVIPPVVIAAVMGLLLALVYGVTKEPIAEAKRLDKQQKLAQVMPQFANDPLELEQQLSDDVMLYIGTVEDGVSGYGLTSSVNTGYSGYFSVVFGLDIEGSIERVRILESFETPGLGSKAAASPFIDQFDGKPRDFNFKVTKDGGDIDAITGATITSRAVCDAVSQGLAAFEAAGGPAGVAPQLPEMTPEGQVANPLEPEVPQDEAATAQDDTETGDDEPAAEEDEPAAEEVEDGE